jgi:hypothetical protein
MTPVSHLLHRPRQVGALPYSPSAQGLPTYTVAPGMRSRLGETRLGARHRDLRRSNRFPSVEKLRHSAIPTPTGASR